MRKLNYFLTLVAGTMLMSACSSDKNEPAPVNEGGVQQIILQVASSGDGLTTRAGRELLSNEAAQDIHKVALVIVNDVDKKIAHVTTVDWTENVTDYTYGKQKSYVIPDEEKLSDGKYIIYAYGYYDEGETKKSDYNFSFLSNLKEGDSFNANNVVGYTEGKNIPEEIFGGSVEMSVKDGSFTKTIVLNRQVAGAYFYVYNIPMLDGLDETCKIQLVASDCNDKLVLGGFNSFDLTGNGTENDNNIKYVVNGTKEGSTAVETVVCEANISDWYSKVEEDESGKVDVKNWIGSGTDAAKAANRKGSKYVKGSIFASNFVIPFKQVNSQTLTLQIVKPQDGEKDKVLHSWKVKLPSVPEKPSYFDASTSAFAEATDAETVYNYSIVRNHLYCIGAKPVAGPTNPDPAKPGDEPDPNDPDPDDPDSNDPNPNDPQDLSKGENLVLKVNHNWEVIYKMELE